MSFISWLLNEKKKAAKKKKPAAKKAAPKKTVAAKKPATKTSTARKAPAYEIPYYKKQATSRKPYYKKPSSTGSYYKKPYTPTINVEKYRPKTDYGDMFADDDMEGIGFHGGELNLKPQPKTRKKAPAIETIVIPKPDEYIEINTIKTVATGKYPVTWKYSNSTKYNRLWFKELSEAKRFAKEKSNEMRTRITENNTELARR